MYIKYTSENEVFLYETKLDGLVISIGLYLKIISRDVLTEICKYLFTNDKQEKRIDINSSTVCFGVCNEHGYYRIELPATSDELESRLSKKGRYNIRREKRLLEESFGPYEIINIPATSDSSDKYWAFYYKKITYGCDYEMNADEYCANYHVTDLYAIQLKDNKRIAAAILSSVQCLIV